MATQIVQPKVCTSTNPVTYDDLTVQNAVNATNATNAIVNSDSSFSGFTQNSNNVLMTNNEIVEKTILLNSQTLSLLSTQDISSWTLATGDRVKMIVSLGSSNNNMLIEGIVPFNIPVLDYSGSSSSWNINCNAINLTETSLYISISNTAVLSFTGSSLTGGTNSRTWYVKNVWKVIG